MQRVAITGMGVVSPLGNSIDEMFANVVAGRSAIRRLDAPRCSGLRSPIGAMVDFKGGACFDVAKLRMLDRVSQFALAAAAQAVADSKIEFGGENTDRCGVSVGCSLGGVRTTDDAYYSLYAERSDRVQPLNIVAAMSNAPAGWVGLEYGLSGPNLTYSTACSSSAVAIGEAARRIQSAEADIMIAGGAEAPLTFGILRAWEAMRTLAAADPEDLSASCRPFALTRTGLVIGEGAAFVVLEGWDHAVARGATIHAELSGYGLASDIGHITRPSVAGQANAMRVALRSGGIQPGDIDYINAHGTATLANDAVETAAIKEVFGARAYGIPVSSTKSVHAHLLGAAGALEFVISVKALERGITPPTMHLNVRDPVCDLDYVADGARNAALRTVMSNSFAFGGTNAVLIATAVSSRG